MKKLKYILTVVLLLASTASVLIFPSVYYSTHDRAVEGASVITELGFSSEKENLSCIDAQRLMLSFDKMETLLSSEFLDRNDVIEITKEAVSEFISGYNENCFLCYVLDSFVSDMENYIFSYSGSSIVGELDEKTASFTYVQVSIANYVDNSNLWMSIDYNTKKIFNISIQGTDVLETYYDVFLIKLSEDERKKADEDSFPDNIVNYLAEYWSVPVNWVNLVEESGGMLFFDFYEQEYIGEYEQEIIS